MVTRNNFAGGQSLDVSESVGEENSEQKWLHQSGGVLTIRTLVPCRTGKVASELLKTRLKTQKKFPRKIHGDATETKVESAEATPEFFVVRPPKDAAEPTVSVGENAGEEEAWE